MTVASSAGSERGFDTRDPAMRLCALCQERIYSDMHGTST